MDSGLVTLDVVNLTSSEQERLSLISKTFKQLVPLLLGKSFVWLVRFCYLCVWDSEVIKGSGEDGDVCER